MLSVTEKGESMERATIYSIASSLGISASTVSRAFSRPDMVKSSVREAVLAKAEEVGYQPNRAARGLATGQTGVFGLLIPDITNPFFPPFVRAVQHAAGQYDSEILLIDSGRSQNAEEDLVRRIRPQVDGLIIASPRLPSGRLKKLLTGIPSVVVNRAVRGLPAVLCDNSTALRQAADHLYQLRHRKFALLRGPSTAWAAVQRARAVREWAEGRTDIEFTELGPIEAQFADGRAAATGVVDSGATAILAFDDLMAAGVIAGLSDLGETVPRDRSIVGCDDVLLAQTMTPSLTTVTAPLTDLGQQAVTTLRAVLAGQPVRDLRLQGELALRGTVAPPRRRRR